MELGVGAQQPAGFLKHRQLGGFNECGVGGGERVLLADLLGDAQQGDAKRRMLARQQARARRGGKRHADLKLGVILPACTVPRIRPAVIENIFALAVPFEIGWQRGGCDTGGVLDDQR